jgi:L-aspartate oxidase
MHRFVGVARDRAGLTQMLSHIASLSPTTRNTAPFVTARLIAACALAREESRGGHYRTDFPHAAPHPLRTFIRKGEGESIVACGSSFLPSDLQ